MLTARNMENNGNLSVSLNKSDINWLNEKYSLLSPEERIRELFQDFDDILFTSSFGTTAVYLIHLMHKQGIHHPIHFIDTTFHFKETLEYKQKLTDLYELEVIDVRPDKKDNEYARLYELYQYDPDKCCFINKVEPLNKIKGNYNVWISGLMGWQNAFRKNLNVFEEKKGILKFYPLIDVSEEEAISYIKAFQLPEHPLKPLGYESIGCKHCTIKGEKRNGRWSKTVKTECGLHQ